VGGFGGGLGIDGTVPYTLKGSYERAHYPSDTVDLKKWFTETETKAALIRQGEYTKVLAKHGWG
jgi:hypothetical protein